jgi:hypothetical protein
MVPVFLFPAPVLCELGFAKDTPLKFGSFSFLILLLGACGASIACALYYRYRYAKSLFSWKNISDCLITNQFKSSQRNLTNFGWSYCICSAGYRVWSAACWDVSARKVFELLICGGIISSATFHEIKSGTWCFIVLTIAPIGAFLVIFAYVMDSWVTQLEPIFSSLPSLCRY